MAELAQPAAGPGHQHRAAAQEPVEEERLVVARVEGAEDVGGTHHAGGQATA